MRTHRTTIAERRPGPETPALGERLARNLPALRSYVRLRAGRELREREPLSDLVQSAAREMLDEAAPPQFADDAEFRRWMHGVVLHKILSKSRFHGAGKRDPRRVAGGASALGAASAPDRSSIPASPSAHAERAEDLRRLQGALDELDETDRELICLRHCFDVPSPEIARRLGMPESTVRWRLARALTHVAARIRSRDN